MCESKVIIRDKGKEKEVVAEASKVVVDDDKVTVTDILGNTKSFEKCQLEEINLLDHKIIFRKK